MAASTAPKGAFVIIAEFEVKPGAMEAFLKVAAEDSTKSVANEPGCHQFAVTVDHAANRVVLFEVYDDQAAFDAHLETPHLAAFRAGIEPLVLAPANVRRLTLAHG